MSFNAEELDLLTTLVLPLSTARTRQEISAVVSEKFCNCIPFDSFDIISYDVQMEFDSFFAGDLTDWLRNHPSIQNYIHEPRPRKNLARQRTIDEWLESPDTQLFNPQDFDEDWLNSYPMLNAAKEVGMQAGLAFRMKAKDKPIATIVFYAFQKAAFKDVNLELLSVVADLLRHAIETILLHENAELAERQKALLVSIAGMLATRQNWQEIFHALADEIQNVISFDYISILVLNKNSANRNFSRFKLPDGSLLHDANAEDFRKRTNLSAEAFTDIIAEARPLYETEGIYNGERYEDIRHTYRLPRLLHECYDLNSAIYLPVDLMNGETLLLTLACKDSYHFFNHNLSFLEWLVPQLILAIVNLFAFEKLQQKELEKSMQLNINNALVAIKDMDAMCLAIATEIDKLLPHDIFTLNILPTAGRAENVLNFTLSKTAPQKFQFITTDVYSRVPQYADLIAETFTPATVSRVYVGNAFEAACKKHKIYRISKEVFGIRSLLVVPLQLGDGQMGVILLCDQSAHAFSENDLNSFLNLSPQISLALENVLAFKQIRQLEKRLQQENVYLAEEIKTTHNFEEIIGISPSLLDVFRKVGQVAPTDSTILIQGETGTGKELIARAIHNLSPRKTRPLIKINCATLPAQLIEDELFGHERGSFTGATDRRIGKFELATNSTIFLDEIGELPLDLQAKLLRVLQEKEVERLGGKEVIKVDVRIVAATNRNLERESAEGKFRADLFYRLSVFPIALPPLRERKEDIEMLAMHFVRKFAKKIGRPITGIAASAIEDMKSYDWPGNIRELEHIIERAVIISDGADVLTLDTALNLKIRPSTDGQYAGQSLLPKPKLQTLEDVERMHIMVALRQSHGRIRGEDGAAAILDIKPTTLEARMKKLGIKRELVISP